MTKSDLADAVALADAALTRKDAAQLVDTIFEAMKGAIADDGELKISGFGKFSVRDKAARPGRNPYTGEPTTISARRVVTFKPSNLLTASLNPGAVGKGCDVSQPRVFGGLDAPAQAFLAEFIRETEGLLVRRLQPARSSAPVPNSTDLETALVPHLAAAGFAHHARIAHPRTAEGFEYDFWRPADGIAIEVMGYRADDEIYKDILKFHVHEGTRVGVVWVSRWKWISGRRTETNYRATMKALAFADSYMDVEALVALAYDWSPAEDAACWRLRHGGAGA